MFTASNQIGRIIFSPAYLEYFVFILINSSVKSSILIGKLKWLVLILVFCRKRWKKQKVPASVLNHRRKNGKTKNKVRSVFNFFY